MKTLLVSVLLSVLCALSYPAMSATTSHADIPTLVMIYKAYQNGSTTMTLTTDQVNQIKQAVAEERTFAWRASNLKAHLNYTTADVVVVGTDAEGGNTLRPTDTGDMYVDVGGIVDLTYASFESGFDEGWVNVTSGDSHNWTRRTGYTPTPNTGPSEAPPWTGPYYIYLETDYAKYAGNSAILLGPTITTGVNRVLTFQYHMYGANIGTLYVDVYSGGTWHNNVWSKTGQQHSSSEEGFTYTQVDLSAYTGSIQVRFRAVAVGGNLGDIALDDILIFGNDSDGPPFPVWVDTGCVAADALAAGKDPASYSVVMCYFPLKEDSEYNGGGFAGLTWGIDIAPPDLGYASFVTVCVYNTYVNDYGYLSGILRHETSHFFESLVQDGGDYYPPVDDPADDDYPIDSTLDYEFQCLNNVNPSHWVTYNSGWVNVAYATDNDQDGVPASTAFPIYDVNDSNADSDGDGLNDLAEKVATYHASSNWTDNDTDDDGVLDGTDPHPLYKTTNLNVAQATPTIDGILAPEDGWTEIAHVWGTTGDLNATIYGAWDNGYLYIAIAANDDDVDADAGWNSGQTGDDLFQLLIDGLGDGWRNMADPSGNPPVNDYVLRFAPDDPNPEFTGGTFVYGYYRKAAYYHDLLEMDSGDLYQIVSIFKKTATTYVIESKIPASALENATFQQGGSVRLGFAFQDVDGSSITKPKDVFTDSLWISAPEVEDPGAFNPGLIEVNFTAGAGGGTVVFEDTFGDTYWTPQWTSVGTSWARVTTKGHDDSYSAEIDGYVSNSSLTSQSIDVTGKNSANVTFWWWIDSYVDAGEYLAFDVSTNGGSTWTQKAILQGDVSQENTWHDESINVDVSATNTLHIRFRGKMNRGDEDGYADQIVVTAQ
ncbi:MAG: hypothetical protein JW889_00060 [Verrucomicrobia bacterium]|nr:hypothetical protein [Verrucomicrobiota bacterium]